MSPRAVAPPIDDRRYWRRLIARAHPDSGGDHELFLFAQGVRDVICGGERGSEIPRREPPRRRAGSTSSEPDRVPFDEDADLEVLSDRAVAMAEAVAEPHAYLLRQVADCYAVSEGPLFEQGRRGASYRSLAAIGHRVGMTKLERVQWYRIAETVSLSQRHAGHILSKLKREAAA